jgi:uridylate kinase
MFTPPKRILVKFSGESLHSSPDETFNASAVQSLVDVLTQAIRDGLECGVVIGAGNLFRGRESRALGLERVVGDQIGMLGTVMNALVVREALLREGITAHVMAPTAHVSSVLRHDPLLARALIAKKEIVLFAGGTGNAFFTTDSAAALRSLEIGASLLVKSTKVNGVYSKDPEQYADAKRYEKITFDEVLKERLGIMDHAAIATAMQYSLSIFVYKFGDPVSILEAMKSQDKGTFIVP